MRYTQITRERLQMADSIFKNRFYSHSQPLTLEVFNAPGRIAVSEALCAVYKPCEIPLKLKPLWSTHWFKVSVTISAAMADSEVHLLWDSTSEACVFDRDGVALQGLTGSDRLPEPIRHEFILKNVKVNELVCYFIEVACNGLFGTHAFGTPTDAIGTLKQAEVAVFNRLAYETYVDFVVIRDIGLHSINPERAATGLQVANRILNSVVQSQHTDDGYIEAKKIAASFFSSHASSTSHKVHVMGHAHIDTAWLWPIAETKRKCVRTFSSAVRYMDDYPQFRFVCSQAQQLSWIEQNHPVLFEKIQKKIVRKQFLPVGGTWVEPDCNIPSGESLARQFLYGQQYFQTSFGQTSRVFWNPDVFGYCGNLPQLMKLSGIDFFLTQKLSWNQFNKIPSSTFFWEGINGSQVLTHFPPADTYTSVANVEQVVASQTQFKDSDRLHHSCLLYGFGDGGGGPTPLMIEMLNRMKNVDGLPQVIFSAPEDFFQQSEIELQASESEPMRWVGELYLEKHRGTYTTHAKLKKMSRQCERALFLTEWLQTLCFLAQNRVPCREQLVDAWKNLLVNHFHDIIPGSSIAQVFDDAVTSFTEIEKSCIEVQTSCFALIGQKTAANQSKSILNATQWPRIEVVDSKLVSVSALSVSIPETLEQNSIPAVTLHQLTDDTTIVANQSFRVTFNNRAEITELVTFDTKTGQPSLSFIHSQRPANKLALYADNPNRWDAWDVDAHYLETPISIELVEALKITHQSHHEVKLQVVFQVGHHSKLTQTICVSSVSKTIVVTHAVEWHEQHAFLRTLFPTNLRAHHALFGIQHGLVERPTHFNTSWDVARFEVPFQHWFSMCEPNRGLAILCSDKFGASSHASTLGLSLLRAPTWPDEMADRGSHQYSYAIYPFNESFAAALVPKQARLFASPLQTTSYEVGTEHHALFEIDQDTILVDCIKVAELSQSVVLRCFESIGAHTTFQIKLKLCPKTVTTCNVLEQADKALAITLVKSSHDITYYVIECTVTPFEILSLTLTF